LVDFVSKKVGTLRLVLEIVECGGIGSYRREGVGWAPMVGFEVGAGRGKGKNVTKEDLTAF